MQQIPTYKGRGEVGSATAMTQRPRTRLVRKLRRHATDAEARLWLALREKLPQYKFRRQHPVGKHVVDFVCRAHDLAIELDGGQHDERRVADAARSAELANHGFRVIRFWNNDVLANLDGVVGTIRLVLESPHLTPTLSPLKGGEGAE